MLLENLLKTINVIPWFVYFGLAWLLNALYLRKANSSKGETESVEATLFTRISVDIYMLLGCAVYICSIVTGTAVWWVGALTILLAELIVILYWNLTENSKVTNVIVMTGKFLKPILLTLAALGVGLFSSVFFIVPFFLLIIIGFSMHKNIS